MLLPPDNVPKDRSSVQLRLWSFFKELKWGTWSLVALYISLVSGILVGLQYDYLNPFYSTTSLDLLAPFGAYFRSLHFYSSQFFFFFCCFHFIAIYDKTLKYKGHEWLRLTATLPIILLLLFTGYILRGDSTGSSAGIIAENIILAIPLLGSIFNDLFFSLSESGLRKVYIHHVIGLDLLFLALAWKHLHTYRIKVREHLPAFGVLLVVSILIAAPFEPEQLGINYISGPWFFLGLQELLRYLPPLLAGVIVPLCFLLLLFSSHPASKHYYLINYSIACFLAAYLVVSFIAYYR